MIGTLHSVVVDTPDPPALARFWQAVLGGTVSADDDTWVVLTVPSGTRLAFQLSPEHRPPEFPDPHGSQQFHLDAEVDDADAAEAAVLAAGATRVEGADGTDFRVFRDPSGHTFCLVYGS
jgi:catechol 2,3-dioxygenase-like lactoylglutathione lyase family enzyme